MIGFALGALALLAATLAFLLWPLARAPRLAHSDGRDKSRLPFYCERLERRHVKLRQRALDDCRDGKSLAGCRLRHEPGCKVDGVAHDRVRPAVVGTDIPREN